MVLNPDEYPPFLGTVLMKLTKSSAADFNASELLQGDPLINQRLCGLSNSYERVSLHTHAIEGRPGPDGIRVHVTRRAPLTDNVALDG